MKCLRLERTFQMTPPNYPKFNLPMENHLYSYRQIKSIRFDRWNYHRNHTGT
jgi:hypothetical protein